MADYAVPNLTTAVDAFNDLVLFKSQSTSPYTIEDSIGTVSVPNTIGTNFGLVSTTRPGVLTGRRPAKGQLFPRGVYNK